MTDAPLVHGLAGTYSNYGCRCDKCGSAMAAYQREYRQRPETRVKRAAQLRAWRARRGDAA